MVEEMLEGKQEMEETVTEAMEEERKEEAGVPEDCDQPVVWPMEQKAQKKGCLEESEVGPRARPIQSSGEW